MTNRNRLELTWVGKDNRPRLEPRILVEDPALSYHAERRVSDNDLYDNRLIFGDNLLALKALEQEFTGKIKCIYIDPPFNTGEALEHYDDGVEHSIWLSLMKERLHILRNLLAHDGSIFIHIDDSELGYLIVLLDEIFGRDNRISIATFKQGAPTGHKSINPGLVTTSNFVLMYAKDKSRWTFNRLFTGRDRDTRYGQFIVNRDDSPDRWQIKPLASAFAEGIGLPQRWDRRDPELLKALDEFVLTNATSVVRLARPDYFAVSAAARSMIDQSKSNPRTTLMLHREGWSDMYFVNGERILFYADKLKLIDGEYVAGEPLTTIWDDLLSNNLHNEGGVTFPRGKKPEALIKRVLELSTSEGDLVLDSFGGSGTTGAVAHKMRRRWILIELGAHCHTHILPRLQRVIDGTDTSGVSQATGWKGGGGFRYYRLAPSLLERDGHGNWIISHQYDAAMLAEAMCKHEGFTYAPSDSVYWQHGHSTESDFIYVTTQTLSHEQLAALSEDVGETRTLLVCCGAFRGAPDAFPNLTLKKIPNAVLRRCEFGRDDYSLSVANLPPPEPESDDEQAQTPGRRRASPPPPDQPGLFDAAKP